MSIYLQARSDHGYLIHAVSADAARTSPSFQGATGTYTYGKALCGNVKGRNAWSMPTMRVVRRHGTVDVIFDQTLRTQDNVCKDCLSTHWVVTQQSE